MRYPPHCSGCVSRGIKSWLRRFLRLIRGDSRRFFPRKCGITTTFVDRTNPQAVEDAIARIAHDRGARIVVDNTFARLEHGADVVVHSLTKFINGASDFIAGAVVGSSEFVASRMNLHTVRS